MDLTKIPSNVLADVVDALTENKRAKTVDQAREKISKMTGQEVFGWYLQWNGILGYATDFWEAAHALKEAEK